MLLLLVIDPFGNVPIVVSALANVAPARRARVVLRECIAAYVILLAFMFGGQTFLHWLQLSEVSLAIAGGIILFLIALRMVFRASGGAVRRSAGRRAVPRAARDTVDRRPVGARDGDADGVAKSVAALAWIVALTAAMVVATIVLLASYRLQRVLGERGMLAVERLMGLVLTALAVQMLLDGVRTFVTELAAP